MGVTSPFILSLSKGSSRDTSKTTVRNPKRKILPILYILLSQPPSPDLDIINYKVARLIREETNDGYLIAEFLSRVMHGTAGQGRPISEADRLRAATELMNRGLGRFGDTRDRRISNTQDDHELINSGLARYIRERTDDGLEPARFLLNVASGWDEGFTMHQRVTATRELIRRGWDTNCDSGYARRHHRLLRKAGSPRTHRLRQQTARVARERARRAVRRGDRPVAPKTSRSLKPASSPT